MRSTESETMKEWENQQQSAPAIPPLQPLNQFGDSRYAGGIHDGAAAAGVGGALYVKVMTDEQLEMLRSQIAIYTSICEELVEMHKNATARQDLSGVRLGNLYCDPLVSSAGHKIVARQRWTPTPVQLQILERIFDQGIGTPSKQKIREIAAELSQHGQISETNVYNWFQNRRARSKRKQINPASNNAESEVEADAESPKEKIPISENFQPQHDSAAAEDYSYQGQEMSSEIHSIDPLPNNAETMFPSNECVRASESLGQLSFYESVMEQPRLDQFMGKMEVPGNYSPYQPGENYSMTG